MSNEQNKKGKRIILYKYLIIIRNHFLMRFWLALYLGLVSIKYIQYTYLYTCTYLIYIYIHYTLHIAFYPRGGN